MNIRNILTGTFALATLVTSARADAEIMITGASAFRSAVVTTIKNKFASTSTNFQFAHNATTAGGATGADRVTFKGSFPGITGTTTIRCSFNGSVEGIRALTSPGATYNAKYITDAGLTTAGSLTGGETFNVSGSTAQLAANFAFSDVRQTSTPVTSPVLKPDGTANAADVGVVVFSPVVNQGCPASLTNISAKLFQKLFKNGRVRARGLTGDAADTFYVYAVGRNDGSGTRTTYMAESNLGIATTVNQYIATVSSGDETTTIQQSPVDGSTNDSTLWNVGAYGNGGYFSGSALRTIMGRGTASCNVLDGEFGDETDAAARLQLLTFAANADVNKMVAAGARCIGWNGVSLTSSVTAGSFAGVQGAIDLAKITQGQYTAWSYEQLYYNGTLSADQNTVYTNLKSGISTELPASNYIDGIPLGTMNASRPTDGEPVTP